MTDELWDNLDPAADDDSTRTAARRERGYDEAPSSQPMKAGIKPAVQKRPTGDKRRFQRAVAQGRNVNATTRKESAMSITVEGMNEHQAMQRLAGATTMTEQRHYADVVEQIRTANRDAVQAGDAFDWDGLTAQASEMTPSLDLVPSTAPGAHQRHTAATDWLGTAEPEPSQVDDTKMTHAMKGEAQGWMQAHTALLSVDRDEFLSQATLAAQRSGRTLFGGSELGQKAASIWLDHLAHLVRHGGAVTARTTDLHCDSCGFKQSSEEGAMGGDNCTQCGKDGNGGHMVRDTDDKTSSRTAGNGTGFNGRWVSIADLSDAELQKSSPTDDEGNPAPDKSKVWLAYDVKTSARRTAAKVEPQPNGMWLVTDNDGVVSQHSTETDARAHGDYADARATLGSEDKDYGHHSSDDYDPTKSSSLTTATQENDMPFQSALAKAVAHFSPKTADGMGTGNSTVPTGFGTTDQWEGGGEDHLDTDQDKNYMDGRDALPIGVDPAKADTFDESTLPGADGNAGGDPKSVSTTGETSPSLSEGKTPEQGKTEGPENPLTGDESVANHGDSSWTDPLPTGGTGTATSSRRTAADDWKCSFCGKDAQHMKSGNRFSANPGTVYACDEHEQKMWDGSKATASRKVADGSMTCATCGASIEKDPAGEANQGYHHADGAKHDHEAKPSGDKTSSRRTAADAPEGFRFATPDEIEDHLKNPIPGSKVLDNGDVLVPKTSSLAVTAVEQPTWSKPCDKCGTEISRYRGQGDVSCPNCSAEYNAGGQRLRDDWRGNMSNYDDEIGDMEGYEMQHSEASRRTAADTSTCVHCGRSIVNDPTDGWVDPEATGDDSIWRETCDENHEDRIAAHEPSTKTSSRYLDATGGDRRTANYGQSLLDSMFAVLAEGDQGIALYQGHRTAGFGHGPVTPGSYSHSPQHTPKQQGDLAKARLSDPDAMAAHRQDNEAAGAAKQRLNHPEQHAIASRGPAVASWWPVLAADGDGTQSSDGEGLGIDEGSEPEHGHSEPIVREPESGSNASEGGGEEWGMVDPLDSKTDNAGTGNAATGGTMEGGAANYVNGATAGLSQNAQIFATALSRCTKPTDEVGGMKATAIAALMIQDPSVPESLRSALKAGGNPFARSAARKEASNGYAVWSTENADWASTPDLMSEDDEGWSEDTAEQAMEMDYEDGPGYSPGTLEVRPYTHPNVTGGLHTAAEQCPGAGAVSSGHTKITEGKNFNKILTHCKTCGAAAWGKKDSASGNVLVGPHKAKTASRTAGFSDTGSCKGCGAPISYDKDTKSWSHDNEADDAYKSGHKVEPGGKSMGSRRQAGVADNAISAYQKGLITLDELTKTLAEEGHRQDTECWPDLFPAKASKTAGPAGPMDRSVIWTLLLHYYPGFGQMESGNGGQSDALTTEAVDAWHAADAVDMDSWIKGWIAQKTGSRRAAALSNADKAKVIPADGVEVSPNEAKTMMDMGDTSRFYGYAVIGNNPQIVSLNNPGDIDRYSPEFCWKAGGGSMWDVKKASLGSLAFDTSRL